MIDLRRIWEYTESFIGVGIDITTSAKIIGRD